MKQREVLRLSFHQRHVQRHVAAITQRHKPIYTRHVKFWKLSAISNWGRAKTCLAYNNWRDLSHLGSLPSGKNGETW
ncbi:hypothetical protein Y032_0115g489 [Ancylostoma ceylanicum]|uniref:Uncharacterized protein n=1 Tax=Ancylostoma ceylanicum TaxID=53326 RepID=A0A016TCS3_9BILA|nr:hypothetical protein Y032_0115g489 [Ancylostoma ceylanicum]